MVRVIRCALLSAALLCLPRLASAELISYKFDVTFSEFHKDNHVDWLNANGVGIGTPGSGTIFWDNDPALWDSFLGCCFGDGATMAHSLVPFGVDFTIGALHVWVNSPTLESQLGTSTNDHTFASFGQVYTTLGGTTPGPYIDDLVFFFESNGAAPVGNGPMPEFGGTGIVNFSGLGAINATATITNARQEQVPEPSTFLIVALGVALMARAAFKA